LNISKPSNGLYYGFFTGTLVYLIFAIPVEQFVLNPEFKVTLSGVSKNIDGRNQENGNGIRQGGQEPTNNTQHHVIGRHIKWSCFIL
jgi:hypothetical protein